MALYYRVGEWDGSMGGWEVERKGAKAIGLVFSIYWWEEQGGKVMAARWTTIVLLGLGFCRCCTGCAILSLPIPLPSLPVLLPTLPCPLHSTRIMSPLQSDRTQWTG